MNFLDACHFKPGEIFQLAAIAYPRDPKARVATKTFEGLGEALAWADEWEGKRNLYFCGNPMRRHLTKKAFDSDVKEVRILLVDADPPGPTEEFLRSVQAKLSGTLVDSGRGHQLWVLHDARVAAHRAAILETLRIGAPVKLDGTHDPSRLMRLPGYTNLKSGRKSRILG